MVETGFHSAKYCKAHGIPVVGAKAFDKKVRGKVTKNPTLWTVRASLTDRPTKIPIHDRAYPNIKRNRKAKVVCRMPDVGRQPTA